MSGSPSRPASTAARPCDAIEIRIPTWTPPDATNARKWRNFRRKARKKPGLKPHHKAMRRRFCREEKGRNWDLVCWSDEVHFHSDGKVGNVTVSRRVSEEFNSECTQPTYKVVGYSVSYWGCFCGPNRGPLVILDAKANINSERFMAEVFIPHFLPFYLRMRQKYGPDVILQQDNASYYFPKERRAWDAAADLQQLNWPSQSPDLSPIKNLWAEVKRRIRNRRHHFKSRDEFKVAVLKAWESLDREVLLKYVRTMPDRLYLCKKNGGGSIKY